VAPNSWEIVGNASISGDVGCDELGLSERICVGSKLYSLSLGKE